MADEVVSKSGFSIGLVQLLQSIVPATVAVVCLYLANLSYSIPFDSNFGGLAVVVAVLTLFLLRSSPEEAMYLTTERVDVALSIVGRWLVVLGILFAIGYTTKSAALFSRKVILTWAVLTPAVLVVMTLTLRKYARRILSDTANLRKAVIVGYNEISVLLARRLQGHVQIGTTVAGFFDDRSAERLGIVDGSPLLGRLPELAPFVAANKVDVIFIALPIRHVRRVLELVDQLRDTTASIYFVPDIFVFDLIQARTSDIAGVPVVAMCETPFSGHRGVIKRMTDVIFSLALLPIVLPLMLVIAVAVKMSSPGPAIFRQRRYGLDGRLITVYKFRTMVVVEDGLHVAQATRNDQRVTSLGRLLRRLSLDELPQLFNVLQGRMSLVGPRPHAVAHNEQYRKLIKGYMVRHKVPPGITGLAQINGCRGETAHLDEMQARVNFDLEYLRRWSPMLDLKILLRTVVQLIRSKKAY